MSRRIAALFLLSLTAGCATPRPETTALTPVAQARTIAIDQPITRLLGSGTIEQGLLPGEYRSTVENAQGTFFQGPQRSFFERTLPNGTVELRPGGFWLPKTPSAKPRLFFVFEPEHYYADNVDAAIRSMTNPATGRIANAPGGVGVQAVGGAIGGALVSAIIESGRGEHFLLGEVAGDSLPAKLQAVISGAERKEPAR